MAAELTMTGTPPFVTEKALANGAGSLKVLLYVRVIVVPKASTTPDTNTGGKSSGVDDTDGDGAESASKFVAMV
jgi:hypothetical protein